MQPFCEPKAVDVCLPVKECGTPEPSHHARYFANSMHGRSEPSGSMAPGMGTKPSYWMPL
jgi:hypothetical protein